MNLILKRPSLVTEATRELRNTLGSELWNEYLPGERVLSSQLHVSRDTLRAALEQLRREGLIQVRPRQRRRILRVSDKASQRAHSKVVCLLSPTPLHSLRPFDILLVDNIREHLAEAGYHLELHVSPGYYSRYPFKALESLVHQKATAAYILFLATLPIQRWFLNRQLPACVAGSSFPDITLPSVDIDYRAVCRHAVKTFFNKGCQQVVLLIENIPRPGDEACQLGFQEGVHVFFGTDARGTIAEHNGTAPGICAKVDALLSEARPPDAFMVLNSSHALTVLAHLLRSGIRLPRQVKLISRNDEWFFEYVVPTVARYFSPPTLFAQKLSHIAIRLARGANVQSEKIQLVPELIPGETLL